MINLGTIDEIASEIGVPKKSLQKAAERHGYLIRIGRALRLDRNQITELLKKCQDPPKEPDSTSSLTDRTGTSATRGNPTGQRAAQAVQMLKKRSAPTSPPRDAQVLRMNRRT